MRARPLLAARFTFESLQNLLPFSSFESVLSKSLGDFHGTWRRFEYKGKTKQGADVYDDYAHHPTAVALTLSELRRRTKGKLFVAFHPHLYSRTKDLFDGFSMAFKDADYALIAPIYAAREEDDGSISSTLLAERITANGTHATALDSFDAIEEAIQYDCRIDTIVTMGAGDIYKVADSLRGKLAINKENGIVKLKSSLQQREKFFATVC